MNFKFWAYISAFILISHSQTVVGQGATCADPIAIGDTPFSYSGTTCGGGDDYDVDPGSNSNLCFYSVFGPGQDNYLGGEDLVFTYTSQLGGCISFSLSSDEGKALHIFTDCPNNPNVECAEFGQTGSSSTVEETVISTLGQTYYIVVSSTSGCITDFDMTVDESYAADFCADAIPLQGLGSNYCATDQGEPDSWTPEPGIGSPDICPGGGWSANDNGVWYTFTVDASTPQPISLEIFNVVCDDTGGENLQLGIWENNGNCTLGNSTLIACAVGIGTVSILDVNMAIGDYYVYVDGNAGANCTWGFSSDELLCSTGDPSLQSYGPYCAGDPITTTLAGTPELPGNTLNWYDADPALGGTALGTGNSIPTPGYFSNTSGSYTVYVAEAVSGEDCEGTPQALTIVVGDAPTAALTGSGTICSGSGTTVAVDLDLTGTGPWDVVYAINGTDQPLMNYTSSPQTISVAEGETITLTSVVANTCSGSVSEAVDITLISQPTATLSGSGSVCTGSTDLVDLNLELTGTGPWDVVYSIDGTDQPLQSYANASEVIQVGEGQTVALVSVSEGVCSGTVSGSVTIGSIAAPTATLSGGGDVCAGSGDMIDLTLEFTGTGPWDVVYSVNGTDEPLQTFTNASEILPAAEGETIALVSVVEGTCSGSVSGSVTIGTSSGPTASLSGSGDVCAGSGDLINLALDLTGTGPWDVVYSINGTDEPVQTFANASEIIQAAEGETIALVSVVEGTCVGTVSGSVTIGSTSGPTATLSGGGDVCAGSGDLVDLSLALTGPGPWDVVYSINGTDEPVQTFANASEIIQAAEGQTIALVSVVEGTCSGTVSGSVTIGSTSGPTATLSGSGDVCAGSGDLIDLTLELTGTGPWDVVYSLDGTDQPLQTFSNASEIIQAGEGQTIALVSVVEGTCAGAVSGSVSIGSLNAPTADLSGSGDICAGSGDLVDLDLTLTGTGPWDVVYAIDGTDQPVQSYSNNNETIQIGEGQTIALVSVSEGTCPGTITEAVNVNTLTSPSAELTASGSICEGSGGTIDLDLVLNGTGPWDVIYSIDGTDQPLVTFASSPQTLQLNEGEVYELISVSAAGCAGSVSTAVTIDYPAAPEATVDTPSPLCNTSAGGSTIDLSSLVSAGDTGGDWTDTEGSGASGTLPNLDFDGLAAGSYTFTYTTASATAPCTEQEYPISVSVENCECPSVAVLPASPVCNDAGLVDLALLQQTTESGSWSLVSDPGGANPATLSGSDFDATDSDSGDYELVYSLDTAPPAGCPDQSDPVIVSVSESFSAGTGTSIDACADETTDVDLFALLTGADSGGAWIETSLVPSSGSAFDAALGTFNPNLQAANSYTFEYSHDAADPCTDPSATITVTVSEPPFVDITPLSSVCNTTTGGSSIDLSSLIISGDATGSWADTDVSGASGTVPNLDFGGIAANTYIFTYTTNSAAGTCLETEFPIAISVEDCACPSTAILPPGDLCNDFGALDLSTLQVTGEAGTWTISNDPGAGNPATISGVNLDAAAADPGQYELTFTLDMPPPLFCDAFSTENLTVNAAPASVSGGGETLCAETAGVVDLNSYLTDDPGGGAWTIESGNIANSFDAANGTFDASIDTEGPYEFTYTIPADLPCLPATALVTIDVSLSAQAGTGGAFEYCNSATDLISLQDLLVDEDAGGTWIVATANEDTGSFDALNASFNPDGHSAVTLDFLYEIAGDGTCPAVSEIVTITILEQPVAELSTSTTICNTSAGGSTLDFSSLISSGNELGSWNDLDGSGAIGAFPDLDFDGVLPGSYNFTYTVPADAPCEPLDIPVQVLVEDCACPSTAIDVPPVLCNSDGTLDLASLQLSAESGSWTISDTPAGSNPADLTGALFDASAADAGDYLITFTLDVAPPAGCDSESSQVLSVVAAVDAGDGSTSSSCADDDTLIDLAGLLSENNPGGLWSIASGSPQAGTFDATSGTFVALGNAPGLFEFQYELETEDPCLPTSAVVAVEVIEEPKAEIESTATTCNTSAGGSIVNFNDFILGGDASGLWEDSSVSGASGSFPNLDFDGTLPGSYTFTYTLETAQDPCTNPSYELVILVEDCECPSVALDVPPDLCNLDGQLDLSSLQITDETGSWSITASPSGSNPASLSGSNFDVIDADEGSYELTFVLDAAPPAGCPDFASITVEVGSQTSAEVISSSSTCNTSAGGSTVDFATFITSGDDTGVWSDIDGSGASGVLPDLDFDGAIAGTYSFTYTLDSSTDPCQNPTYDVSILVEDCECPSVAIDPPGTFCNSLDNIELSDYQITNEVGTWSITSMPPGDNPVTLQNSTLSVSGAYEGDYELTFTLGEEPPAGCPSSSTQVLELINQTDAGTGGSLQVCNSAEPLINLADLLLDSDGGGTWEVLSGDLQAGTFDANGGTFDASSNTEGSYVFAYTLSANDPCEPATTEVTVFVAEEPSAELTQNANVCNTSAGGSTVSLTDLLISGDFTGIWTELDDSGASGLLPDLDFDGVEPGNYNFVYSLNSAAEPCENPSYNVAILIEDCECPSVATTAPEPACSLDSSIDLSQYQITSELGGWTVTAAPAGTNPAQINGDMLDFASADPGQYELTFTLSAQPAAGCPESSSQTIIIAEPATAGQGLSESVCAESSGLLTLSDYLENADPDGNWSSDSGNPVAGSFDALTGTFDASLNPAGVYGFEYAVQSQDPCPSDFSNVTITVEEQPTAVVSSSGSICNTSAAGSLIILDDFVTAGDQSGSWTETSNSGAAVAGNTIDFDGVTADSYSFVYALSSAVAPCENPEYAVVILVEDCECPSVAISSFDPTCNDDAAIDLSNYQVTDEAGTWSLSGTPAGTNPANLIGSNLEIFNADEGTYELTFTLAEDPGPGCPINSVQLLQLAAAADAGTGGAIEVCSDDDTQIDLATLLTGAQAGGFWTVSNGVPAAGSFDASNALFDPSSNAVGEFEFTYTIIANDPCEDSFATVTVIINQTVSAELSPGGNTCNTTEGGSTVDFSTFILNGDQNGDWVDIQGSGASGSFPILDFDGVEPGNYDFSYTLNSAIDPCINPVYTVAILVEDCSCPSVAINAPPPACNTEANIELTALQVTEEAGTWSLSSVPAGPDPAVLQGDILDIQDAAPGSYELTFTLVEVPPQDCPTFSAVEFQLAEAVAAGSGSEVDVCNTSVAPTDLGTLLSDSDAGGTWSVIFGAPVSGSFDNVNGTFDQAQNLAGQFVFQYEVSAQAPCPSSITEVVVNVFEEPFATLSSGASICNTSASGSLLDFDSLIEAGDTSGSWTDVDGSGASGDFPELDFDSVDPGPYTFAYSLNSANLPCENPAYEIAIVVEDCSCPSVLVDAPPATCANAPAISLLDLQITEEPGIWSIAGSTNNLPQISGDELQVQDADAGEYDLTFTLDNPVPDGCANSLTVNFILSQPVSAGTGSSAEVCEQEGIQIDLENLLSDNDAGGTWSVQAGSPATGTFNAAGGTFDPVGNAEGIYTFEYSLSAADPCSDSVAEVTVNIAVALTAEIQASANTCNSVASGTVLDFTEFIVDGDPGGIWSDDDASDATGDFDALDFDGVEPGTYSFSYSLQSPDPCPESSYQISILVEDCECPSVATLEPQPVCADALSIDLAALTVTNEEGSWSVTADPGGTNAVVVDGNSLLIDGADSGTYELTFTLSEAPNDGCPETSVQELFVAPTVSAGTGSSIFVCNDDATPILLVDLLQDSDSGGAWNLASGTVIDGSFDPGSGTFSALDNSAGEYEFEYSIDAVDPCPAASSLVTINVIEQPAVEIQAAANTCNTSAGGSVLDFSAFLLSGDSSGDWIDVDDSGANGTFPVLDFDGLTPGSYNFTYSLSGVQAPCLDINEQITVLVEDCACPSVATSSPDPLCNANAILDLAELQVTTAAGSWTISAVPDGSNPAALDGSTFDATGADPGAYELTFTLDELPPDGCLQFSTQVVELSEFLSAGFGTTSEDCTNDGEDPLFLFGYLSDADPGGTWSSIGDQPDPGTFDPIAGTFENFGHGPGNFEFVYSQNPDAPCSSSESTITYILLEQEFATLVPTTNTCNASSDGSLVDFSTLITDGETDGLWTDDEASGANGNFPLLDFDGVDPGTYIFSYELTDIQSPCVTQQYAMEVVVEDCSCPSVALTNPDPLCNDFGTLDLSSLLITQEPGSWSISADPGGGNPAAISSAGIFEANEADAGLYGLTYTLDETVQAGCPQDASVEIIVAAAVDAGNDNAQTSCNDPGTVLDLTLLLSPDITGGIWSVDGAAIPAPGAFDVASGSFTVGDLEPGVYEFDYTLNADEPCAASVANFSITVEFCDCEDPAAPIPVLDQASICEGDEIQAFFVETPASGTAVWYDNQSAGSVLTEGDSYLPEEAGTYYAAVRNDPDDGCESELIPFTLQINAIPTAIITIVDDEVCLGDVVTYSFAGEALDDAAITWFLDGIAIANGAGPHELTVLDVGEYQLSVVVDQGPCSDDDFGLFSVSSVEVSTIEPAGISLGQSIDLISTASSNPEGAIDFQWTDSSGGISGSSQQSPTVQPQETSTYTVTAQNEQGCEDQASTVVTVIRENSVLIPNAFSPNGDGLHDVFEMIGVNVAQSELYVYDRWGVNIFASTDILQGWDGTFKGEACDLNVYVYYALVTFDDGQKAEYQGNVSLLR